MSVCVSRPSLSRRVPGFTPAIETATLSSLDAAGVSEVALAAVLDGNLDEPEGAVARAWLTDHPSITAAAAWWALARRSHACALAAELGVDPQAVAAEKDAEKAAKKAAAAAEKAARGERAKKREARIEAQRAEKAAKLQERIEAAARVAQSVDAAAKHLRSRYVYASARDEIWDRRAKAWLQTTALTNLEAHAMPLDERGRRFDAFVVLRNDAEADKVHRDRYLPGIYDEIAEVDNIPWLNTWVAPTVEPAKGDASLALNHILYLCNGNKEQAGAVLDWLAYVYQNPGKKINHTVLLISNAQGTGKDTIAKLMERALGQSNVYVIQDKALENGRNHFMKTTQLVVVPEIMAGDRKDIANGLKPLITQSTIEVNEKHLREYVIPNTANFLLFSNHEDAAHIEDKDRRFFVIICRAAPKDEAYYDALYDYIDSDRVASFAHVLATRDLSKFKPMGHAPMTEDKKVVQLATMGAVQAWLHDAYESRVAPFDRDIINLREALSKIADDRGAPKMSIQQVASFLKRRGGADLGARRLPEDGQMRLWAIRDGEAVAGMSSHDLQDLYRGASTADYKLRRSSLKTIDGGATMIAAE